MVQGILSYLRKTELTPSTPGQCKPWLVFLPRRHASLLPTPGAAGHHDYQVCIPCSQQVTCTAAQDPRQAALTDVALLTWDRISSYPLGLKRSAHFFTPGPHPS